MGSPNLTPLADLVSTRFGRLECLILGQISLIVLRLLQQNSPFTIYRTARTRVDYFHTRGIIVVIWSFLYMYVLSQLYCSTVK